MGEGTPLSGVLYLEPLHNALLKGGRKVTPPTFVWGGGYFVFFRSFSSRDFSFQGIFKKPNLGQK